MKKPRPHGKQPHAIPQCPHTRAGNPDRDDRVAGLIAAYAAGGEIDELALAEAAERDGFAMPAIWSALERDGWRVDDGGVYRRTRAQRPTTPQVEAMAGDGYLGRLVAAARTGDLVRPGEVTTVTVSHDDGCPRLYGAPCCCIPDIEARGPDGRVRTIDANGEVVATARQH